MKRLLVLFLCALLLLGLAACKEAENAPAPSGAPADSSAAAGTDSAAPTDSPESSTAGELQPVPIRGAELPTVLNQTEYVLYQNIFYNGAADDYLGKTFTKEGTFTRLTDAFSGTTRYYVWGYMDATKCCDWQWEFVPKDPDSLPANGSLVKMTGVMTRDEAALDKIWFTDAELTVEQRYQPEPCDVDMTTMDGTLERVQLQNMQYRPGAFQGKSLRIYGRVASLKSIQHPYYDNAWVQDVKSGEALPAIGTMVIVTGAWMDGVIAAEEVEPTGAY